MLRRALLAAGPGLLFATGASAQAPIEWGSILIYQSELLDSVFPDERELSDYIGRLKSVAEQEALAEAPVSTPGVLFVALAPGGRSRVWLLATSDRMAPSARVRWETALSAVTPISVTAHFLFGLSYGAGGAAPYESDGPPPIPSDWEAQVPAEGVMLDDVFIGRVWPPEVARD